MLRAFTYYLQRASHGLLHGPRLVLRLLLSPFRWIGSLFRQTIEWWSRREMRYLLRGLPSVIVFSTVAYLVVACRLRSDTALAETYLNAAHQAEAANKPEIAALLLERVVRLRPADDVTLYALATMARQSGDLPRSAVLMQQLAPETAGQGYAPAQLQMGKFYLARQQVSADYRRKAEAHLQNAWDLNPQDAETNAALGQLYYSRGVWDQAIKYFEAALPSQSNSRAATPAGLQIVNLVLAKAYSFEANRKAAEENSASAEECRKAAEKYGKAARQYFEKRVADDPHKDIEARIILADACMFLEDFDDASKVLQDGLALNPENQELPVALARFNVAWADAMHQTGSGTPEEQFELLSTALLLDPNYLLIFDRMMDILTLTDDATAAKAREFLLGNVTAGRSIGLSHLLLGTAAYQAKDPQEAARAAYHLEQAFELLPNALVVKNNLAWFLAFQESPDLDRALFLINDVLDRAPTDPRFLDTRGQIYTKLLRWDEAIVDLERALEQTESDPQTHAALAICYDAKGYSDIAERHLRLAEPATAQ
jgi:tetratricopeptide (TPR) repeat protein